MKNLYKLPVFGITGLSNIRFNKKALLKESAVTGDLRIGLFVIPNPETVSEKYKTTADLRHDPFLILKATPFDNKDLLRRKGEELSLFDDDNNVDVALNMVTSPVSRLYAEMHTVSFICKRADDIDYLDKLKDNTAGSDFYARFCFRSVAVPQVYLLAILNGVSHALVYSDWDPFEFNIEHDFIYHAVSAFDALNVNALTKELNIIRKKAGIAPISENKVEDALRERKYELIQDIEYMFSRMQTLSLMRYMYALGGYMKKQYGNIPDVLGSVFERCQSACFEFFDNNIKYVDRLFINILETCLQKTNYQIRKYYICQLSRLMYPMILSCMPNEVTADYTGGSHDKRCFTLLEKLSKKAISLAVCNYFPNAMDLMAIHQKMSELLFLSDSFRSTSASLVEIIIKRKNSFFKANKENFKFSTTTLNLNNLGWRIDNQPRLFFRDIVNFDLKIQDLSFIMKGKCVCEEWVYKDFTYTVGFAGNGARVFLSQFFWLLGYQRLVDIVARVEEELPQKAKVSLTDSSGGKFEFLITEQGLLSTNHQVMLLWKNLSMQGDVTVDSNKKMCLELSHLENNRKTIYKLNDIMTGFAFSVLYGDTDNDFHRTYRLNVNSVNS